ncbi:MAG: AAA family ATPase [Robiginitomaculum sp.]|nr:AAA family ATPase [Robiginitomaculum sp.]
MSDKPTDDNILDLVHLADDELVIPEPVVEPASAEITPPQEAQIWAYLGVVGGVGVTSLAVQTAWELSKRKAKVLLIDLNFERGDCAAYLDMPPSLKIAELNKAEGRMDEELAATFINPYTKPDNNLVQHAKCAQTTLSVFSAEGELGGNDQISPIALLSFLDCVSDGFDFIILDIPPMWRSWTQAAIGAADKFALVTEARVPALHQARKLANDITALLKLNQTPEIILNKYERRALRGGLSLIDTHKVLTVKTSAQICVDDETLRAAINTGTPPGTLKPNSRYTKSVHQHVQNWLGLSRAVKQKAKYIRQKVKPIRQTERRAARQ